MQDKTKKRARAILSLDGGGVRGVMTIAFIKRLESELRERDDNPTARLCDYFDLIGGTSTGSIIATALSLGLTATEIERFYFELAPLVFRRSMFRLIGYQAVFDEKHLRQEVLKVFRDRTLDTKDLLTSLAIVMKRIDTGSPWIVTNSPNAAHWETPADDSYIGNRHYRIAELVRASTAAPHYFAPESISIVDGEHPGLFVDGGVTPHNNPSMALFHQTTIPANGFGWKTGQEDLLIVSVGTGTYRERLDAQRARKMSAVALAFKALAGMIADAETFVLTQMQLLGQTDTPWLINSEIGDLAGVSVTPEPLFTFQRYNALLEMDWLKEQLGISLDERELDIVRKMEDPRGIPTIHHIGTMAAKKFMHLDHVALLQRRPEADNR